MRLILAAILAAAVPATAFAAGEPVDGFPSWSERVVHVWVNRARADPQADLAGCPNCGEAACYEPTGPLGHDHNLTRAARFHSANLALSGSGLQHDSPCTLVADIATQYTPGPCDGNPACACEGGNATCGAGGCTEWSQRVAMFGTGPAGENAAAGYTDPVDTFYLWLWEPSASTSCGFSLQNGHRYNILTANGSLGVGNHEAWWTQDFGGGGPDGKIIAGAHYPATGTVSFYANWFDGAAPATAAVNIDGTCHTMTLERGVDPANATYAFADHQVAGCQRYLFVFEDAGGTIHTYPDTGSFGVGCPDEWTTDRPASCAGEPPPPDAGPGTPPGADADPDAPDASGNPVDGGDVESGCGCQVGGAGRGALGAIALLSALCATLRRGGRRYRS